MPRRSRRRRSVQEPTGRQRRLGLAAVLLSTLGLGVAYGVGFTITTLQFEAWGQPGWLIGLAASMPGLAVLLLPPSPRLAVRVGTVPAMIGGAVIAAGAFTVMPVLDSPGWWILLRFVSGIGLTLPWLVRATWINTVSSDAYRGRVLGVYTVRLFGGGAGGPLRERLGTTGSTPFRPGYRRDDLARSTSAGRAPARAIAQRSRAVRPRPRHVARAAGHGRRARRRGHRVRLHLAAARLRHRGRCLRQHCLAPAGGAPDRRRDTAVLHGLARGPGGPRPTARHAWPPAERSVRAARCPGGCRRLAFLPVLLLGGVAMAFYALGLTLGEQVPADQLVLGNAGFFMAYAAGGVVGPLVGGAAMDLWEPHGLALVIASAGLALAAYAVASGDRRSKHQARGTA